MSQHESGRAAAETYAKKRADIIEINRACMIESDVKARVAQHREVTMKGSDADSKSVVSSMEEDSEDDMDMSFASYLPASSSAAAPKKASKVKSQASGATPAVEFKRRRTLDPPIPGPSPFAAPCGMTGPEAEPDDAQAESDKVKKAKALLDNKKIAFSDDAIWEGKSRPRAFTAMAKALEDGANKIIGENEDLARVMLEFPETATVKADIFQKIKKDTKSNVQSFDPQEECVLRQLSPPLLSKIFVSIGAALLKDFEETSFIFRLQHSVLNFEFLIQFYPNLRL